MSMGPNGIGWLLFFVVLTFVLRGITWRDRWKDRIKTVFALGYQWGQPSTEGVGKTAVIHQKTAQEAWNNYCDYRKKIRSRSGYWKSVVANCLYYTVVEIGLWVGTFLLVSGLATLAWCVGALIYEGVQNVNPHDLFNVWTIWMVEISIVIIVYVFVKIVQWVEKHRNNY
jgi:hypothetical protein